MFTTPLQPFQHCVVEVRMIPSVRPGLLGCPDGEAGLCISLSLNVSSANVSTGLLTLE